jgi:hypothetical protein
VNSSSVNTSAKTLITSSTKMMHDQSDNSLMDNSIIMKEEIPTAFRFDQAKKKLTVPTEEYKVI